MGCPHNEFHECFTCADERHTFEHPELVADCLECKLSTIQLSPRVNGGGRFKVSGPPAGSRNSWERGRACDERGVPYLDQHGPIPVKRFAEGRQKFTARIRELRTHPDPFAVGPARS